MTDEMIVLYLKNNCLGRNSLISGKRLQSALRVGDTELRRRIARLRRKGVPIASSREGYFYAQTAGEVYATIRQLKGMASGLEASIAGLEQALEKFGEGGETNR